MILKTDLQKGKLVTFQLIVTVSGTETLKLYWWLQCSSACTIKKYCLRILLCQKPTPYADSWGIKDTLLH